jgi:hypothetical protein
MASKPKHTDKARRQCPNCYYPLPVYGDYCSHCGQKYTDGKLTVWSLIREFFADTLNLESRIWQTLLALFVPGKLTKTFFKGRQRRYVSPLRLFFVTAITFFAVLSYWGDDFAEQTIGAEIREAEQDTYFAAFLENLQKESDTIKTNLAAIPKTSYVLDSLYRKLHSNHKDSLELGVELSLFLKGETNVEDIKSTYVAKRDIVNMDIDSLLDYYAADKDYLDRLIMQQNIRFYRDGASYVGYLISKLIWMMLIMMPLLALVLKLLYIRHNYYYIEHLIFSFHTHAFLFIILSLVFILTGVVMPVEISETTRANFHFDAIAIVAGLAVPFYFFVALLKVYGQSILKTFLKFFLLNFFYILLFIFASVLTFAVTALLF